LFSKLLLTTFLIFGLVVSCIAQTILEKRLDGKEQGKALVTFINELEKNEKVRFYFIEDWISAIQIENSYSDQTLASMLDELFLGTPLSYIMMNQNSIVFVKDARQDFKRNTIINNAINNGKKVEKLTLGKASTFSKNQKINLKGNVVDEKSKTPIVGAAISFNDSEWQTTTGENGLFQIQLPAGTYVLRVVFANYEERVLELFANESGTIEISLEDTPTLLNEVTVSSRDAEITTSQINVTQLSMKEIKRAPAFMGEVDLIKQIQLLPGVTTVGEAASGFNVRGGGVDQNLILYDGLPVFNSSHALGFFSAFNSEAVKDVTFYRGGIPSEFGGRVSSVLDIKSKEGDFDKWNGGGGLGIISSNLQLGGPIVKDKTSLSASARSTYSDYFINSIKTNYADLSKSSVLFYDATVKVAHKFSEKTKLTFSGYISQDQFRLQGDSTYRWNNLLTSLKLDHVFSPKLNSTFMAGYGTYGYEVFDASAANAFKLSYKITYPQVKADFHYQVGSNKLSFGGQANYYGFDPGTLTPNGPSSNVKFVKMQSQQSVESAVYTSYGFSIGENTQIEAGARLSSFTAFGAATINLYKQGLPLETLNRIDTLKFKSGEAIKTYNGVEPRLSFRYSLTPSSSIKIGYNRIFQYLNLVTNTAAVTPIDIWQPSGYYFRPQRADQISLGFFKTFKEKKYDFFVEGYYKDLSNILDYKDGAQLILNTHLETDLLQGNGKAYGIETQIAKQQGRLVGSFSYTYSRSLLTTKGNTFSESINNGNPYPSNFDQPHIVNLNWKYALSKRLFFTGNFVYRTGRPVTTPVSAFLINNISVANFSERNQFRIPDYHRLDLAFVIEGSHKRRKFWDGTWTFSVYNIYARKNPFSVYFKEVNGFLYPYQLSILGTALPSLSYSFKF
jgi:hypothetical protein